MATTPSKRALLIGIDEYPNLGFFQQLEGCVNDATAMGQLLRDRFGFPDENVSLLTNGDATRAGILAAFDALLEQTETDDIVVVHFAGHGSQITDLEGDEPDGLDETIVPYDGVRITPPKPGEDPSEAPPNVDVTDDEIEAFIQRMSQKTGYLTLIFDCCHSGTLSRDTFGAKARSLTPDTRPPDRIGRAPATSGTRSAAAPPASGPSGWLPLDNRYVMIAGCRDEQCSYEYTDPETQTSHGAMTYFLTKALREATPGTTYRDVYDRVRPQVTAHSSKQHPQMEGALDREIFGVQDVVPMSFVGVESREGASVTLAGGAAHGLSVGSEWAVYAPGTKTTDDAEPIGRVRVSSVGATNAEADVVEEAERIDPGARAVEDRHSYDAGGFRVAVAPEHAGRIQATPVLTAVGPEDPADARLYLLDAREAVADDTPVPQLGPLAEPTWAAVGADGRLLCPPHAASERDVEALMADNLRKVARYRAGLALDNPTPGPLKGAIALTVQRLENGAWVDAEPEAGGALVFEEGDRLAFMVTNNHTEDVFVNVLDFGLSGAVSPLTVPGSNEALAPGKSLRVGYPKGIPLGFPKTFPFVREPFETEPDEGLETLKAFVTLSPTDFGALGQAGVRDVGGPGSTLGGLLRKTFQGATRDLMMEEADDEPEDWTTITRPWVLRRRDAGTPLSGAPLDLGGLTIQATGLEAEVRVAPAAEATATRSLGEAPSGIAAVLARENVRTLQSVTIQNARVAATRSLEGDPELRVTVEAVPGHGQAMLHTDADGVLTWHVPQAGGTRSLGDTQTFVIGAAAPPPAAAPGTRGLGDVADRVVGAVKGKVEDALSAEGIQGAVTSQILDRLVFPLVDPLIGKIGDYAAAKWEALKRPYGLRPFTPADYRGPAPRALPADGLERLGEGRSLLFVHGTFSRAHVAFGGLDEGTMAALHDRYGGRVFAFDHFTLSDDPAENVRQLVARLPDDAALDVDVVAHSRGGLVGRVLTERQAALSLGARSVRVGKVVFVASPNAGTALADPEHMGDLVDAFTNVITLIPGNPHAEILDAVLMVVKQLAVGVMGGLDGLRAMQPDGAFLRELGALNGRGDTRYFGLAAAFEPQTPGLRAWAQRRLVGRIFGGANDLVVPTASVYGGDGAPLVAEADRRVFDAGVAHSTFFQNREAQDQLLAWLSTD